MDSTSTKTWFRTLALAASLMTVLAGCSTERDQDDLFDPLGVDLLVIDGVLIVGQTMPEIRLSRTQPPTIPFSMNTAGVQDALISVMTPDSTRVTYRMVSPGIYYPEQSMFVMPNSTYDLEVSTQEGERLTATTVTPGYFNVNAWVTLDATTAQEKVQMKTYATDGDSVFYAPENQLPYAQDIVEARFDLDQVQGYMVSIFSLDPDSEPVIDPPFFDEEDFADLERQGSSPIFEATDGRVRLPWFAIYFEGRYNYKVYAVDTNWYDLIRTTPLNDGGFGSGSTAGEGVERPIFHVNGGIGLFGSGSVDSVGFYVHPAP